jgi:Phage integrase family
VQVLRAHRRRQLDRRAQAAEDGKPWTDSGYLFTRSDGLPINPNYATTRFRTLVRRSGLPPVRLHDLRHGAASLAHQAGADLKTLQDLLGHSSIVVTADTYTSVLPPIQRRCADTTAQVVLTAARRTRKKIKNKARKNRPGRRPTTGAPAPATPRTGAPARTPRQPATKPQVTPRQPRASAATGPAPTSHPGDTHRPNTTETGRPRSAFPLVTTLIGKRARRDSNP